MTVLHAKRIKCCQFRSLPQVYEKILLYVPDFNLRLYSYYHEFYTPQGISRHCTLWKTNTSPSCRAVLMLVDKLNLNVQEVDVDMDRGEHKCPELVSMNPFRTLPIMKDKDFVLHDSHAIMSYLVGRYCKEAQFMPQDPGGRSLVEQAWYYHSGVLHPLYQAAVHPILYRGVKCICPNNVCDIERCYADLDCMLKTRVYLAGRWPTPADMSIAATVSTLNVLVAINKERYSSLSCWLHRMSQESYYMTANSKGLNEFVLRIDCGPCGESKEIKENETDIKCTKTSYRRRYLSKCPMDN